MIMQYTLYVLYVFSNQSTLDLRPGAMTRSPFRNHQLQARLSSEPCGDVPLCSDLTTKNTTKNIMVLES
uniref:Uncharacterized protein n=1 Tax=Knipowitschia caucasica TaxID=637954 RepID=A0AAV2J9L4_KNICA